MFLSRICFFMIFFCICVYKSSAGWDNNKICPPDQFGLNLGKNNFNNFGNNKNQKKLNNNNNNFNRNNDGINSVYKYLASQGLSLANKGIVRINNCDNTVRFEDRNGNITPGKLDDKGKFLPFNKSGKSLDK